jgi:hypothetical protein
MEMTVRHQLQTPTDLRFFHFNRMAVLPGDMGEHRFGGSGSL